MVLWPQVQRGFEEPPRATSPGCSQQLWESRGKPQGSYRPRTGKSERAKRWKHRPMQNCVGTGRGFVQSSQEWEGSTVSVELWTFQNDPPGFPSRTKPHVRGNYREQNQNWAGLVLWTESWPTKTGENPSADTCANDPASHQLQATRCFSVSLGSLLCWHIWVHFCSSTLVTLWDRFVFTIWVHLNFNQLVLVLASRVIKKSPPSSIYLVSNNWQQLPRTLLKHLSFRPNISILYKSSF